MKKRTTLLLLFLLILSIYTSKNVQNAIEENDYRPTSLELTPHAPISITSDSYFEVFPGTGTAEDPYVIEGYNITTTSQKGIYITDTTEYFIVRNCYVDAEGYGIHISFVADGTATVINNTCNNNYRGIYLDFSVSSTVVNNTCSDNNDYGIYLDYSASSTVVNNTCSNNNYKGIYLFISGSSTAANNTFTNCGLDIHESTVDAYLSYTVENNWVNGKKLGFYTNLNSTTIAESVYGQLILVNCTNLTVRDQILNNATTGLFLYFCTSSVIINNTCSNNDYRGISLSSSSSSTVANNTCSNNWGGIVLESSGSSNVINNTFTNCGLSISEGTIDAYLSYTVENNWVNDKILGFYTNLDSTIIDEPIYGQLILINCTNVTIRDQILNNASIGLFLCSCTSSVIVNNTCSNNNIIGIYLFVSGSSTVANNTCNNNDWRGILLEDSVSSTVANNTCNNNWEGIKIHSSVSSTVANNTCNDNNDYGIALLYSVSSTVANNTFTNCGLSIYEYSIDTYLSYTVENNWVNGKKLGFYTNLDSTIIDEPIYGQLILVNCTNITVRNQILNNATTGLFLYFCTSSVIINNTCSNNDYRGISISGFSDSFTVSNNTCNNNWEGISLSSSSSSTVANNTCNNNYYGIYLYLSAFCVVAYNLLQENEGYGVYLNYYSDNNIIHHNTFVDNNLGGTSQAYDRGLTNTWYDTSTNKGNYWSDWSGSGSYSVDGSAGAVDLYPLGVPVIVEYPQIVLLTLLLSIVTLFLTRKISKKLKKE